MNLTNFSFSCNRAVFRDVKLEDPGYKSQNLEDLATLFRTSSSITSVARS